MGNETESLRVTALTPVNHVFGLTRTEKEYFARAAKNQNLCDLARLMRNQGMRPEEVLSLKKADVDLERGTLHVREGKTPAARRTVDLTAESKSILAHRISPPIPAKASSKALQRIDRAKASPWVFPSAKCPGRHIQRLNRAHDAVCAGHNKRLALSFVMYDFRHTFATRLAQAGVDLATLAAILGHNSIRIVQKYVHPTAKHKKAAMERYENVLADLEKQHSAKKDEQPN